MPAMNKPRARLSGRRRKMVFAPPLAMSPTPSPGPAQPDASLNFQRFGLAGGGFAGLGFGAHGLGAGEARGHHLPGRCGAQEAFADIVERRPGGVVAGRGGAVLIELLGGR